jgi:hypothetical protein
LASESDIWKPTAKKATSPENGLLAGVSTMNHFLELSEEEWDFNFRVNSKDRFRKG